MRIEVFDHREDAWTTPENTGAAGPTLHGTRPADVLPYHRDTTTRCNDASEQENARLAGNMQGNLGLHAIRLMDVPDR